MDSLPGITSAAKPKSARERTCKGVAAAHHAADIARVRACGARCVRGARRASSACKTCGACSATPSDARRRTDELELRVLRLVL
eukprot:6279906-Prymnesium_polylepis.1